MLWRHHCWETDADPLPVVREKEHAQGGGGILFGDNFTWENFAVKKGEETFPAELPGIVPSRGLPLSHALPLSGGVPDGILAAVL